MSTHHKTPFLLLGWGSCGISTQQHHNVKSVNKTTPQWHAKSSHSNSAGVLVLQCETLQNTGLHKPEKFIDHCLCKLRVLLLRWKECGLHQCYHLSLAYQHNKIKSHDSTTKMNYKRKLWKSHWTATCNAMLLCRYSTFSQ